MRAKRLAGLAGQAALTPVWLAQLFTGYKSFGDNPIIGARLFNEWGLHEARLKAAHRLAAMRRARLAAGVSAGDTAAFARDGFVLKRAFLPRPAFEALRDQVRAYRGKVREMVQGDTVTRRIPLSPPALAKMPAVRSLIELPEFAGLVQYVHSSAAAPNYYVQTILTQARGGAPDPQTLLHADTFQPTIKAWFFLTDVAEDAAPFVYVPGSHRLTPERLAWERRTALEAHGAANRQTQRGSFRIAAEELPALGLPAPRAFAVPANTLVVADTFGFHARGPSLAPAHRVEVWVSGRRSPFLPWTGLDVWRLGSLAAWRMPLFWALCDVIGPSGLVIHPWALRTDRGAFDPDDGGKAVAS
jgi:hypothetical protein